MKKAPAGADPKDFAIVSRNLVEQGHSLVQRAEKFQITDHASAQEAGGFALMLRERLKAAKLVTDPFVKAAQEALAQARAQRDAIHAPYEGAQKVIDEKLVAWNRAQEEERALEAKRVARQAELAAAHAREAEIARAEELGDDEAAVRLAQAPVAPVVLPPQPQVQRPEGIHFVTKWSAEVHDLAALVKAVAAGLAPVSYLEPNMTALNQRATADQNNLTLPGVRAVSRQVTVGRTAARR